MEEVREALIGDGNTKITSDGRVFSKRNKKNWKEICTKIPRDKHHYKRLFFRDENGECRTVALHRLIALNFVECEQDTSSLTVNHINGDKWDNRADNLEWCTSMENTKKAVELGLFSSLRERKCLNCNHSFYSRMYKPLCEDCVSLLMKLERLHTHGDRSSQDKVREKALEINERPATIARRVGCHYDTIYKWLSGERYLSFNTFVKVSDFVEAEYERKCGNEDHGS